MRPESLCALLAYTLIDHVPRSNRPGVRPPHRPGSHGGLAARCGVFRARAGFKRAARFTARFGDRLAEFEIVDFIPTQDSGVGGTRQRTSSNTSFRLDSAGAATAVTIREVWTPRSLGAWCGAAYFRAKCATSAGRDPPESAEHSRYPNHTAEAFRSQSGALFRWGPPCGRVQARLAVRQESRLVTAVRSPASERGPSMCGGGRVLAPTCRSVSCDANATASHSSYCSLRAALSRPAVLLLRSDAL